MIAMLMYFFLGLGTTAALWTACIGMFNTRGRAVSTTFLFALFFVVPMGYVYMHTTEALVKNEYVFLYALSGFCVVAMVLLVGAGTKKNGVICTKREGELDRERAQRHRSASRNTLRTPGSARNRNMSRARAKSNAGSSGTAPAPTGSGRNYQMYESPAGAPMPLNNNMRHA